MNEIGNVSQFKVLRKTDIGYVLDASLGEIFLHNNETNHKILKPGDLVTAFLYYDFKGRIAATLNVPYVTIKTQAFLKVKDVNRDLGIFLDMGISKDLLLSKDDLPSDYKEWPIVSDEILVTVKVKGRMVAKIVSKEERLLKANEPLELKSYVDAFVYKIGAEGINLVTKQGHDIFVHHTMYKEQCRIGQSLSVKITFHSERGYSGSLIEQKENAIITDASQILKYLEHKKKMPLDSDSTPEHIFEVFHLSKKAFKRALGHLYKERKIRFENGMTFLIEGTK